MCPVQLTTLTRTLNRSHGRLLSKRARSLGSASQVDFSLLFFLEGKPPFSIPPIVCRLDATPSRTVLFAAVRKSLRCFVGCDVVCWGIKLKSEGSFKNCNQRLHYPPPR
uniref:(northern house mosquito) hypothetical protein n=1 Tax=Culex pipiens TaxID=7175 RepID=A0A8D8JZP3_CULPI